jgi:hypothetical protein
MLFRVCDHYSDSQEIIQQEYNECFICFEYQTTNEKEPNKLRNQLLYLNNCICDGSVHDSCLKIWFNINKSCPICRIKFIEYNKATMIIFNYIPFGIRMYTFITSNLITLFRLISVMLFFYVLMDCYLTLYIIKNQRQYDDYNYLPNLDDYHYFSNEEEEQN